MTVSELCREAGYHVYLDGATYAEVDERGQWPVLLRLLHRKLMRTVERHFTVIIRTESGERTCHDVGMGGERVNRLDPYNGNERNNHAPLYHGVKRINVSLWAAVCYFHGGQCLCVGRFNDPGLAALAHDQYAVMHGMKKAKLNFPALREKFIRECEGAQETV